MWSCIAQPFSLYFSANVRSIKVLNLRAEEYATEVREKYDEEQNIFKIAAEIKEKISQFAGTDDNINEQDYESIAVSKLKTEKYEKYIDELYKNAEITNKIFWYKYSWWYYE